MQGRERKQTDAVAGERELVMHGHSQAPRRPPAHAGAAYVEMNFRLTWSRE
ncbi:hypothetical protein GCM10012320_29300 [Sinomonas cellulolyticus]|nr:hypothetical protein GCM10012320_29300 [Sinomonas sp. KCTC 49339]